MELSLAVMKSYELGRNSVKYSTCMEVLVFFIKAEHVGVKLVS